MGSSIRLSQVREGQLVLLLSCPPHALRSSQLSTHLINIGHLDRAALAHVLPRSWLRSDKGANQEHLLAVV